MSSEKQYKIDRIIPLKDLKRFLIYLCFPSEKRREKYKDTIKLLFKNKDLFLMKVGNGRIIVRGDEVIPYKTIGSIIVVKVKNLKEIEYVSMHNFSNLKFIKINENEVRLIGNAPFKTFKELHSLNIIPFEEIEKIFEEIKRIKAERIKARIGRILREGELRSDFERKAIDIAINEEIKEGRKTEIASTKEPYDIISYGNSPDDIRYIEVKGRKSSLPFVEIRLTKNEYNFAKEKKDKYWVYSIFMNDKNQKIIKIQNPAEKLKWIIRHSKRRKNRKARREYYHSYIPFNEGIKNDINRL